VLIWLLSVLVGVGAASILVLLIYEGSREMEVVEAWGYFAGWHKAEEILKRCGFEPLEKRPGWLQSALMEAAGWRRREGSVLIHICRADVGKAEVVVGEEAWLETVVRRYSVTYYEGRRAFCVVRAGREVPGLFRVVRRSVPARALLRLLQPFYPRGRFGVEFSIKSDDTAFANSILTGSFRKALLNARWLHTFALGASYIVLVARHTMRRAARIMMEETKIPSLLRSLPEIFAAFPSDILSDMGVNKDALQTLLFPPSQKD